MRVSNLPAEVGGVLIAVTAMDDVEKLPAVVLHDGEDGGEFLGMGELDGVGQRRWLGLDRWSGGVLGL
jgi:hypothetical protein